MGFRRDKRTLRYRCPKQTTFTRVLSQVDTGALETVLLNWQRRLAGPVQDSLVIIDGKKMRHGGVEMVNATNGQGQYLGGMITQAKSTEIPAARQVLRRLDLAGKIVLADALHTQLDTGQQTKSKFNTKSFRQRFLSARGGRERLHALIFAK